MNKYKIKNSKEFSRFSKEIEAFKYNGNLNEENMPDWFTKAVEDGTVIHFGKVNNKDKLFIFPHGIIVEDGHYIAKKLGGNIGALTEEMLNEYYDKID